MDQKTALLFAAKQIELAYRMLEDIKDAELSDEEFFRFRTNCVTMLKIQHELERTADFFS